MGILQNNAVFSVKTLPNANEMFESANYQQVTGKLNLCQTRHTPQISPFRFTLLASIPFQIGSIAD